MSDQTVAEVFALFERICTEDGFALSEAGPASEGRQGEFRVYCKGPHALGLTWDGAEGSFVLRAGTPLSDLSRHRLLAGGAESAEQILAFLFAESPGPP